MRQEEKQTEGHQVPAQTEKSTAETNKVINADQNDQGDRLLKDASVQELQFELMRNSNHLHVFTDVKQMINDLKANPTLWRSCYTFNSHWGIHEMVGIHEGDYYVDSICILTTEENDEQLFEIAERWGAEEMDWLDSETDAGVADIKASLLKLCFY